MEETATLRLAIDTGDVGPASDDLERLSGDARKAEESFDKLGDEAKRAAGEVDDVGKKSRMASRELDELRGFATGVVNQFARWGTVAASVIGTLVFKEAIDAARESEQVWAQVTQGIQSTGGAARRSLEDIQALASGIQNTTLFDDETVAFGAANLLTFTNIAEEAFDRTLRAATDVSTRVGQDFKSTIIQLGKALNDPIANLGALSRTGIQFSDVQKEQIANLVEQNKLFEAQAIILTEIEAQYGGSAAAVREAGGGAKAAANAFGDLLEIIGGPALQQSNDEFEELAKLLSDPSTIANVQALAQAFADLFEGFLQGVNAAISGFNRFLTNVRSTTDIGDQLDPSRPEDGINLIRARQDRLRAQLSVDHFFDDDEAAAAVAEIEELNKVAAEFQRIIDGTLVAGEHLTVTSAELVTWWEALSKESAEVAKNAKVFDSGLQQQISDLEALVGATRKGGTAVKDLTDELEIRDAIAKLREQAATAGAAFDEEAERARLRQIQLLERELQLAQQYATFIQDFTLQPVQGQIGSFSTTINSAQFEEDLLSPTRRDATISATQRQLEMLRKIVLELGQELDPETFNQLFQQVEAAGKDFEEKVTGSGDYVREQLEAAANAFIGSILDDLLFNQGRGIDDIFKRELQDGVRAAFIDPLSSFLSGDSDDLLGGFEEGIQKVTDRFGQFGKKLDDLLGTGGALEDALGAAGAGFAGFGVGTGVADIFNGDQGETGSKVGGAVGGGIGFAIGGPVGAFIGSAAGSFLGDILGGLFGRKTARGTIDLLTGDTSDVKDSKKGSRNERRDEILGTSFDAIEALADILDARIRSGVALEVSAGKRSISLDLVDPRTGRVIQDGGSDLAADDVSGAIDRALQLAIDGVLEGGDELLSSVARAFATAKVPADELLDSIAGIASILEATKPPTSDFIEALEEINDTFQRARDLAGAYSGALQDLNAAQLEVLEATARAFDDSIAEQLRRINDPLAQDALDLAESQQLRLREAEELNAALTAAAQLLQNAGTRPATQATVTAAFGQTGFRFDSLPRELRDVITQSVTSGASSQSVAQTITDQAADAQERLNAVIELNTAEWRQFIEQAANSPEAFRAAAAAIEELREQSADLPIDFEALTQTLEQVRAALAVEFDASQEDRLLQLTDPLQAQFQQIFEQQQDFFESARALSTSPDDLEERLAREGAITTETLRQLIEQSGTTQEALLAATEALERFAEEAAAAGADTQLLLRQIETARLALADQQDEDSVDRILRLVSAPSAELRALLQRQRQQVEQAQGIGANVELVQRANALELEQFLDALSDADLASLGDVFGLITEQVGRLPVVLLELDDAFDRFVDQREDEIRRLNALGERGQGLAEQADEFADRIRRQFSGRSPIEEFRDVRGELLEQLNRSRDSSLEDDARLDASELGLSLSEELLQSIERTFGGLSQAGVERDALLAIVEEFEAINTDISERAFSLEEALEREFDVLVDIRDALQSDAPNVSDQIANALSSGQLNALPDVVRSLLLEFVNLSNVAQQNRDDLTNALRDAAIEGFSQGVNITGTVSIDDRRLADLLQSAIDTLNRIEDNQNNGSTVTRLLGSSAA